jgi:medium-chain acyl-[acyl-carrier-protein] hydrolase
MKRYHHDFEIGYADMDNTLQATAGALLKYSEEVALLHCEDKGFGLDFLSQTGQAWFQLKSLLFIAEAPVYRQKFRAETWASEISASKMQCGREYSLFDEQGGILAYRKTWWLFINTKTYRPVQMSDTIIDGFGLEKPALDISFSRFTNALLPDNGQTFPVLRSNIDTNRHVNNTAYWTWALEAIPHKEIEGWQPLIIETLFKNELKYGQKVSSTVHRHDKLPYAPFKGYEDLFKNTKTFEHFLYDDNGRLAAQFFSVWRPLES